ncbi:alpha/beta hydrolase [Streptomyces sp. NPDC057623]|uniref:alpha/beta hydrolase n=1 Tax=Streptomyces sp. NPDC057623 TaxID=3346187 RepID=UPI00368D51E6
MTQAGHLGTDDSSGEEQRVLLLGFDADGRVVMARNNPDHARYVVILVPGVGAGPSNLDPLLLRAESLCRELSSGPDDDAVSVITWVDYKTPGSPADARDPEFAAQGALRLARFIVDRRVTAQAWGRRTGPQRITVIGHGYGGLVAGFAARDHGMDIDALVLLGAPSAGTDTVGELRLAGPVYATSAEVNGDGTPYDVHGPRPDSPGFGATVLHPGPLSYGGDPTVRYLPSLKKIVLGTA